MLCVRTGTGLRCTWCGGYLDGDRTFMRCRCAQESKNQGPERNLSDEADALLRTQWVAKQARRQEQVQALQDMLRALPVTDDLWDLPERQRDAELRRRGLLPAGLRFFDD